MSALTPGQQWWNWFLADVTQPLKPLPWEKLSRRQRNILERVAHLTWESACVSLLYTGQPRREKQGTDDQPAADA
jgi:hypothetical protein